MIIHGSFVPDRVPEWFLQQPIMHLLQTNNSKTAGKRSTTLGVAANCKDTHRRGKKYGRFGVFLRNVSRRLYILLT